MDIRVEKVSDTEYKVSNVAGGDSHTVNVAGFDFVHNSLITLEANEYEEAM